MQTAATAASLVAALALGFAAGTYEPTVAAQDAGGQEDATPTMEEMMAAMQAAGTPGAHHRLLDPFVGTWKADATFWMDPSTPAMTMTGKLVSRWILDGHHLEQTFTGEFLGEPFEGRGTLSYDNAAETYRGTWMDSSSTGISVSAGFVDDSGETFTMYATDTDPMTGESVQSEDTIVIAGPDSHTYTRHMLMGDERVKSMEIVYTRAKAGAR